MSKMVKVMDGFAKDENGKFHIIPMTLPECMKPSSTKKSDEKRSTVRRKYIPIGPLRFTPADFEDSPENASKKRKIDRPVRKELFKVPQKPTSRLSSYSRSSITPTCYSNTYKRNSTKNITYKQTTGHKKKTKTVGFNLVNIDENEGLPSQKSELKKCVKTVLFPIVDENEKENSDVANSGITPILNTSDKNELTPKSNESMKAENEFLELEKMLASAKKGGNGDIVSPVTSVCALLANTKITKTDKNDTNNRILSNITSLIKKDKEQFEVLSQQFENYRLEHQKNFSQIAELIESIGKDKENTRKSLRIASQNMKNKFVVSPAIANKVDLRKTTLNNNLSRHLQFESPRSRKAAEMYNTLRNDCSVLSTPKLDKSTLDLSQASVTRSLSRRIQKQCLMLQDTPRPS